jgi:putative membrane protein
MYLPARWMKLVGDLGGGYNKHEQVKLCCCCCMQQQQQQQQQQLSGADGLLHCLASPRLASPRLALHHSPTALLSIMAPGRKCWGITRATLRLLLLGLVGGSWFEQQQQQHNCADAFAFAPPKSSRYQHAPVASRSKQRQQQLRMLSRGEGATAGGSRGGSRGRTSLPPLSAIRGPVRHSPDEWVEDLISLPTSRVLKRIRLRLGLLMTWTAAVTLLMLRNPAWAARCAHVPHGVLSASLSLLLVFRTNTSYARFWEGRTLLSKVIGSSRELCRLTVIHISDDKLRQRIGNLVVAHAVSLKQHLQGEIGYDELAPFLSPGELQVLKKKINWPTAMQLELSKAVHAALASDDRMLSALHEGHFDEQVHELALCCAHCERLVKQPIPLSYNRHASRYLTMYLCSLPVTLVHSLGWLTLPTMFMTGYLLLSLLDISFFVENPFLLHLCLIPISQLVMVLRLDVAGLLGPEIFPDNIEEWDQMMLKSQERYVRQPEKLDTYFEYYADPSQ